MLFQMLACLLAIKHDTAVITLRVRLERVRYIYTSLPWLLGNACYSLYCPAQGGFTSLYAEGAAQQEPQA